jgi:hypothetical protein
MRTGIIVQQKAVGGVLIKYQACHLSSMSVFPTAIITVPALFKIKL